MKIDTCIYIYVCVCMCIYIHVHAFMCVCVCVCVVCTLGQGASPLFSSAVDAQNIMYMSNVRCVFTCL